MTSSFRAEYIRYPHMLCTSGQAERKKAGAGECVQIPDLTHTLEWDFSANTVYCITLFILLSASFVSLNTFSKHKNIMFVTAAVSPVWYKAEQQYSICLSKTSGKDSLLFAKSFPHI